MEYQIQDNTRRCAASGRDLHPGDKYFSVLMDENGKFVRLDYACDAWRGPPDNAFSFWTGRMPPLEANRRPRIDNDLLMDCFERLSASTEEARLNFRYVVALLLMRRRRLKFDEARLQDDQEILRLHCTRTGTVYEVVDPRLSEPQMEAVQDEVFQLLGWDGR